MWNLKINDANELTYKTERDTDLENELTAAVGEGIVTDFGKVIHTLLYLKWITKKACCIAHGTLLTVMCQAGWEGHLDENGYMYVYC